MRPWSLLRRSSRGQGLLAVGLDPHGVGVASVLRPPGGPPALELIEYRSVSAPEEQAEALRSLVRRHGLRRQRCTGILGTESYSLSLVDAPEVPAEEQRTAMRWRVRDLIDFPVEEAVLDLFDVPPQKGHTGRDLKYVVVSRIGELRRRLAVLRAAGLRPFVLDVPELALRNLAALLPEDVAGTALIYLTRDTGMVLLTRRATLYLARRFPSGLGAPTPGQGGAVLDELVVQVQRSLDYYESHFDQAPIASLLVVPSDVVPDGLATQLAAQLGLAVRFLDLESVLDVPGGLGEVSAIPWAPLVGAALRGVEVAA